MPITETDHSISHLGQTGKPAGSIVDLYKAEKVGTLTKLRHEAMVHVFEMRLHW